jgi:endonuclease/exonuclease/phosphatase family metal-dependent hydrolase
MTEIRLGTFNVENLFSRAKVLNFYAYSTGDDKLELVGQLQRELEREQYDKPRIIELYVQVKDLIKFNVLRRAPGVNSNIIVKNNAGQYRVSPNGRDGWYGFVEFVRDKFSDVTLKNTAAVLKAVKADVLCLVEVESRLTLDAFNREQLAKRYDYNYLLDGNDDRGIDIGILSRFPFKSLQTHIFEKNEDSAFYVQKKQAGVPDYTGLNPKRPIFSRDCVEVELTLPGDKSLFLLCNHFKSKSGGDPPEVQAQRTIQADRVATIIQQKYDLSRDLVAVMGDFNDTPTSNPLKPLMSIGLHDVLALQFANPTDRWTYFFNGKEQIDYILVSEALRQTFVEAGVERRGIAEVAHHTNGQIQPFPGVTSWRNAASDHAAVWAKFSL